MSDPSINNACESDAILNRSSSVPTHRCFKCGLLVLNVGALEELASANGEDGAAGRQCRTLFSTHYHTLVDDFCSFPSVALKHMACLVETAGLDEHPTEESVTFLYKLTDGACPKSYGFYAAKLAGVPAEIIRESYEKSQQVQESYANKLKRLLSCLEKLTHCDDDVELVKQIQKLQSV